MRQPYAERADRDRDVLEVLLAEIFERPGDLAAHLLDDDRRRANAARQRKSFQARRHVDAVAEDLALFDKDRPEVDADAETQPIFFGNPGFGAGKLGLHRNGTCDRIDRGRELGKHVVAGRADDAAVMLSYVAAERLAARPYRRDRRGIVFRHAAAVADGVGAQDRAKVPLDTRSTGCLHRERLSAARDRMGVWRRCRAGR